MRLNLKVKIEFDYDDLEFIEYEIKDLLKGLLKQQKDHLELRGYILPLKDIERCRKILKKIDKVWD